VPNDQLTLDRVTQRVTRVAIVDDHRAFADLLALAICDQEDFECVGVAHTVATAVELAAREEPDVVALDLQLGAESGLDAARQIRAAALVQPVIVVVSAHSDPGWMVRASQVGVNAFAAKTGSLVDMLGVLRRARDGSTLLAPSLLRGPARTTAPSGDPQRLTVREHDVLRLMGLGMAPGAIARLLDISTNTCRGYVRTIHAKLGVQTQLEAVVKAQRLGLIEATDGR
jgi:DNA-binding NarL/FixJ family response regulator